MIKAKNGKVKIKGKAITLGSEYARITNVFLNALVGGGIPKEDALMMVEKAYQLGLKTEEEVFEEAKRYIENLSKEEDKDNE